MTTPTRTEFEAAALPPLPPPWSVGSTMKCAVCETPYAPIRPSAMAAGGFPSAHASHTCKCGSTTFAARIGYDSSRPAIYTADQMREYARTAIAAHTAQTERERFEAAAYRWLVSIGAELGLIEWWRLSIEDFPTQAQLDTAIAAAMSWPTVPGVK